MKNRRFLRHCVSLLQTAITMTLVWAFAISSFAQDIDYGEYGEELNGPPKSYVPVYIITIAVVGLALTLVCRTSRRQMDFRSPD